MDNRQNIVGEVPLFQTMISLNQSNCKIINR